MTVYLIPIFGFGLLITGIVFLGILQAAEFAKAQASQHVKSERRAAEFESLPPGRNAIPILPLQSDQRR
jgi:hypothetical protein